MNDNNKDSEFENFKFDCNMRFRMFENAFNSRVGVLTTLIAIAYALIGYLLARSLM